MWLDLDQYFGTDVPVTIYDRHLWYSDRQTLTITVSCFNISFDFVSLVTLLQIYIQYNLAQFHANNLNSFAGWLTTLKFV